MSVTRQRARCNAHRRTRQPSTRSSASAPPQSPSIGPPPPRVARLACSEVTAAVQRHFPPVDVLSQGPRLFATPADEPRAAGERRHRPPRRPVRAGDDQLRGCSEPRFRPIDQRPARHDPRLLRRRLADHCRPAHPRRRRRRRRPGRPPALVDLPRRRPGRVRRRRRVVVRRADRRRVVAGALSNRCERRNRRRCSRSPASRCRRQCCSPSPRT